MINSPYVPEDEKHLIGANIAKQLAPALGGMKPSQFIRQNDRTVEPKNGFTESGNNLRYSLEKETALVDLEDSLTALRNEANQYVVNIATRVPAVVNVLSVVEKKLKEGESTGVTEKRTDAGETETPAPTTKTITEVNEAPDTGQRKGKG